jgi:hypothetical protein
MTFSVHYEPQKDIIESQVIGKLDLEVLTALASEVCRLLLKHDCKLFFNDLRNARHNLSTIEIYLVPEILKEIGLPLSGKRALLVSTDLDDYAFFETTSVNRGHRVKVFTDPDLAIDWLRR